MTDNQSAEAVQHTTETRELTIINKFGIHARPAALFVKTAAQFKSDIIITKDGMDVNGKSIMGLLTLEGHEGSVLIVTAEGPDALEAVTALEQLVLDKFNEE